MKGDTGDEGSREGVWTIGDKGKGKRGRRCEEIVKREIGRERERWRERDRGRWREREGERPREICKCGAPD